MSDEMVKRDENSTALAVGEQVERVLISGDLSRLTAEQRVAYFNAVCKSLGLNPLTRPLEFLTLQGKTVLYARRDATEQLRKLHGVSIQIVAREVVEEVYVVTARAMDRTGRADESIGAVPLGNLKGEARANAIMKAETKAKRRVTLSICGLGMLDETEIDSIPGARPMAVVQAPRPELPVTTAPPLPPIDKEYRELSPEEARVFEDPGVPAAELTREQIEALIDAAPTPADVTAVVKRYGLGEDDPLREKARARWRELSTGGRAA